MPITFLDEEEAVDAPIAALADDEAPQEAKPSITFLDGNEDVYIEESEQVISAPVGLESKEILKLNAIQNEGAKEDEFLGFTNIGSPKNFFEGYIKGIINLGVSVSTADSGLRSKRLETIKEKQAEGKTTDFYNRFFVSESRRGFDAERESIEQRLSDNRKARRDIAEVIDDMGLNSSDKSLTDALGQGAVSFAVPIATKSVAISTAVMGTQTFSDTYQEGVDSGLSVDKAFNAALVDSGGVAVLEAVGTNALFKIFKSNKIVGSAVKGFFQQGSEEATQEIWSILTKNGYDITDTSFREAVEQVLASFVVGGILGAPVSAIMAEGGNADKIKGLERLSKEDTQKVIEIATKLSEQKSIQDAAKTALKEVGQDVDRNNDDNLQAEKDVEKLVQDIIDGKEIDPDKVAAAREEIGLEPEVRRVVDNRDAVTQLEEKIQKRSEEISQEINIEEITAVKNAAPMRAAQKEITELSALIAEKQSNGASTKSSEKKLDALITKQGKVIKSDLIGQIVSISDKVSKSKNISIDRVNKIKDLVSGFTKAKPSDASLKKAQEAVEFFKRNPNKDVPKKITAIVDRVSKKGFSELSANDLQSLLNQIKSDVKQGQTKLKLKEAANTRRFANSLAELREGTVKFGGNKPAAEMSLEERVSVTDKAKQAYQTTVNKAQRLGLIKNQMDVIFDVFDGNADYDGVNHRTFKQPMDKAHNNYYNTRDIYQENVIELAKKSKLKKSNYNRIGVYAILQQEGGESHLLASGYTKAQLNDLKLNDAEMAMHKLMRKNLDALEAPIKKTMAEVHNKDFSGVKNYFPFQMDFDKMNGQEISEMFGDTVVTLSPDKFGDSQSVQDGFTKERTGGGKKIKVDALAVYLKHTDNASYFIEMSSEIESAKRVANSQEYNEIAGELGQEIVSDWVSRVATRGGSSGGGTDLILNKLRKNVGLAILGYKISTIVIQPTALADGAALVGGGYVGRGITNVVQKEWRQFVIDNMAEVKGRVGDDPNYVTAGGSGKWESIQGGAYWGIKKMDGFAASSVAIGAYIRHVEQNGGTVDLNNPDKAAIKFAELMVRRTQASGSYKDAAPLVGNNGLTSSASVNKLIFQFQTFVLNQWSLFEHDMIRAGFMEGKTKEAVNIATWLVIAKVSENLIRETTKDAINSLFGIEKEEDDENLAKKVALDAISSVPYVSQVASVFNYGSVPVPSLSLMNSAMDSVHYAGESKSAEKKIKHYTGAALLTSGVAFGVPATLQTKQLVNKYFSEDRK